MARRIGGVCWVLGNRGRKLWRSLVGCLLLGQYVALDKDFAVGGHAGFRESEAVLQLQLDSDDLLHAVVAEVGIFGSEGGLGIDARDVRRRRACLGFESR